MSFRIIAAHHCESAYMLSSADDAAASMLYYFWERKLGTELKYST